MSGPFKFSRRSMTIAGAAVVGAAAVAGIMQEAPRLLRHRAGGEYVDLVNRLDDSDRAATVGRAILAQSREPLPKAELDSLKTTLKKKTLANAVAADAASGRLVEADGWVLPATVATLCVLAAQSV